MELKDFVKNVITDITEAVSELQGELTNGAIVSPSISNPIVTKTVIDPNDHSNRLISKINFDVAITAGSSDKTEGSAKAGIQIFSARIGDSGEEHTENVSRITFTIPVVLPTVHIQTAHELAKEKFQPK